MGMHPPPPSRLWTVVKAALSFAGIGLIGAAIIFLVFVAALPPGKPDRDVSADGIVVLTGTAVERLITGIQLLEERRGKRLLISGVYQGQGFDDIAKLGHDAALINCCLDLDYHAETTVENAQQTAQWARVHEFSSLLIVTSAHHMPRAMLEFRRAMPHLKLTAYPVVLQNVKLDKWWRYPGTFALLLGEYARYILSLIGLSA
jgi:uncharacterized SAM-binding protein YcdF (DUF218 family)